MERKKECGTWLPRCQIRIEERCAYRDAPGTDILICLVVYIDGHPRYIDIPSKKFVRSLQQQYEDANEDNMEARL